MLQWPPARCPGAGPRLWATLQALHEARPRGDRRHFVEVFAGAAAVSRNLRRLGFEGFSLDVRTAPTHDVLRPEGLVLLLDCVLSLEPCCVLWCAPPCSTWVFLSRGSTHRSKERPEGDVSNEYVLAQDALVERLALVLEVATIKGVWWILEQPANSLMWEYPATKETLQRHSAELVRLDMGAFGGTSVKPTHLVGTAPYLQELARTCSAEDREQLRLNGVRTAVQYTDAQGQKRCYGSAALKGTQAYPDGFGAAHALAFKKARVHCMKLAGREHLSAEMVPLTVVNLLPKEVRSRASEAWWLRDLHGGAPFASRPAHEQLKSARGQSSSSSS